MMNTFSSLLWVDGAGAPEEHEEHKEKPDRIYTILPGSKNILSILLILSEKRLKSETRFPLFPRFLIINWELRLLFPV
jgi:hypothetical protein